MMRVTVSGATTPEDDTTVRDATVRVGAVRLTVAALARSLAFYQQALGLVELERSTTGATLGVADRALVVLDEVPGARPAPRATGLFHFALLVPDRPSLARWLAHATRSGVALQGMSDHFVSEAIYLADPDGHGIEIYADRPRALWEGQVHRLTTAPLDVSSLLAELPEPATEPFAGLPGGTAMGHVHLQVRDVAEASAFYRDVIGLELMATYGTQAAFLAAGGYHHHVGVNSWNSLGSSPAPAGSAALVYATIIMAGDGARDAAAVRASDVGAPVDRDGDDVLVRDPSGTALLLSTG